MDKKIYKKSHEVTRREVSSEGLRTSVDVGGDMGTFYPLRNTKWGHLYPLQWIMNNKDGICGDCFECCRRHEYIRLNPFDIERISNHLSLSIEDFVVKFVKLVKKDGKEILSLRETRPCSFLKKDAKSKHCSIYQVRPTSCLLYPFLQITGYTKWCSGGKEAVLILSQVKV